MAEIALDSRCCLVLPLGLLALAACGGNDGGGRDDGTLPDDGTAAEDAIPAPDADAEAETPSPDAPGADADAEPDMPETAADFEPDMPAADADADVADAPDGPPPAIWRPHPGTSWQIQLQGRIDTSFDVAMYDIDLFDTPDAVFDELHGRGVAVVCYFSAGSWEEWRDDASDFPRAAIGNPLSGWTGEYWLDTRDPTVRSIMERRLDLAVRRGCDAVDPDNVDGYTNDPGFPLTYATQLDYNRFLATAAHARGLGVGLKNDLNQIDDLVADFDFAVNEECFDYDECDMLLPFIGASKAVFQITYGDADLVATICPRANALDFDTLIKQLDLGAWRIACR